MSWSYEVDDDQKFEEEAIFDGVRFHTGRWGRLQTTILWGNWEKTDEKKAMEAAEDFLSKPLTREWFEMHKDANDLPYLTFVEGQMRGDLVGGRNYYGSSVIKEDNCCMLVIDCDS